MINSINILSEDMLPPSLGQINSINILSEDMLPPSLGQIISINILSEDTLPPSLGQINSINILSEDTLPPSLGQIRCLDGEVVSGEMCDHMPDCYDESDELECGTMLFICQRINTQLLLQT